MSHGKMPNIAETIERVLGNARQKSILVIGDVMLDEYVMGEVKRVSPEAPVPIVEFRSRSYIPGGAANVAANIAALDCKPVLVGVTGDDNEACCLRSSLERYGVDLDFLLTDADRPTTLKTRLLGQNQQIARLDREVQTAIPTGMENAILHLLEEHIRSAKACLLSDYGKGVVTPRVARGAISLSRAAGVPILVDPKRLGVRELVGANLIKPNKVEAERLAGREFHDQDAFLDSGEELAAALDGTAVLITRGALGMTMFRHHQEIVHVIPHARNVYDVTGAGDTVMSMLGVAISGQATFEDAVVVANRAAAIAVGKLGTAVVRAAELRASITC